MLSSLSRRRVSVKDGVDGALHRLDVGVGVHEEAEHVPLQLAASDREPLIANSPKRSLEVR
jgi:hypothetical protein